MRRCRRAPAEPTTAPRLSHRLSHRCSARRLALAALAAAAVALECRECSASVTGATRTPIGLSSDNPRYFSFRGENRCPSRSSPSSSFPPPPLPPPRSLPPPPPSPLLFLLLLLPLVTLPALSSPHRAATAAATMHAPHPAARLFTRVKLSPLTMATAQTPGLPTLLCFRCPVDPAFAVVCCVPACLRAYCVPACRRLLITSTEHFGALINLDFDYKTYLETLASPLGPP